MNRPEVLRNNHETQQPGAYCLSPSIYGSGLCIK